MVLVETVNIVVGQVVQGCAVVVVVSHLGKNIDWCDGMSGGRRVRTIHGNHTLRQAKCDGKTAARGMDIQWETTYRRNLQEKRFSKTHAVHIEVAAFKVHSHESGCFRLFR